MQTYFFNYYTFFYYRKMIQNKKYIYIYIYILYFKIVFTDWQKLNIAQNF